MEKKLKNLFDYQRFAKNERLEKMISDSESRYGKELTDDDLSFVSAAGDPVTETSIGGIAGHNDNGTIKNCYNTGGITGDFTDNYAESGSQNPGGTP